MNNRMKKFLLLVLIAILSVILFFCGIIIYGIYKFQEEKGLEIEVAKKDSIVIMRSFELGYTWGRIDLWEDSLEARMDEFEKWMFKEGNRYQLGDD